MHLVSYSATISQVSLYHEVEIFFEAVEKTNKNTNKKTVIFFLSFFFLNKEYLIIAYKVVFPYKKIKIIIF